LTSRGHWGEAGGTAGVAPSVTIARASRRHSRTAGRAGEEPGRTTPHCPTGKEGSRPTRVVEEELIAARGDIRDGTFFYRPGWPALLKGPHAPSPERATSFCRGREPAGPGKNTPASPAGAIPTSRLPDGERECRRRPSGAENPQCFPAPVGSRPRLHAAAPPGPRSPRRQLPSPAANGKRQNAPHPCQSALAGLLDRASSRGNREARLKPAPRENKGPAVHQLKLVADRESAEADISATNIAPPVTELDGPPLLKGPHASSPERATSFSRGREPTGPG